MRPLSTIRRWHFKQLRATLKIVAYIVQTNPAPAPAGSPLLPLTTRSISAVENQSYARVSWVAQSRRRITQRGPSHGLGSAQVIHYMQ